MIPTVSFFVFLGAMLATGEPQIFQVNVPFETKAACEQQILKVTLAANLPEGTIVLDAMCGRVNSAKEIGI